MLRRKMTTDVKIPACRLVAPQQIATLVLRAGHSRVYEAEIFDEADVVL
jgi:hypothetical protein